MHFCLILLPLASYTYLVIRRVIILRFIKLMAHSESQHTNYSLLKNKKSCRDVINKEIQTACFSVFLLVYLFKEVGLFRHYIYTNNQLYYDMLMVLPVLRVVLLGTKRCYKWYYEQYHLSYEVLRESARYYEWYQEVLQVLLHVAMWYYKRFEVQQLVFKKHSSKRSSIKIIVWKNFSKFTRNLQSH